MAKDDRRHPIARKPVVLELPGMDRVVIRRDVRYRKDGQSTMDLYVPPDRPYGEPTGAVLFVNGYPDAGAERAIGCRAKEMESFISWGRLVAASGMVGVLYTTASDPARDARDVLQQVDLIASSAGIDAERIAIWACSGHGPTALSLLMQPPIRDIIRCAVLSYSFLLDLDGSTAVAEASRTFGFVNPASGGIEDLPRETPLFVARAGRDELPSLNETLDRFVTRGLQLNLPLTVVNHATGPHAFDVVHDSDVSRQVIAQMLAFLKFQLMR
jgi:hypothetical protein